MKQEERKVEKDKVLRMLTFNKEVFSMVYGRNIEKGFHPPGENEVMKKQRLLVLVISEIGEAFEAIRTERYAKLKKFENNEVDVSFAVNFADNVKNSLEDELADICIRLYDYAGCFGISYKAVLKQYEAEMYALEELRIQDSSAFLFALVRSVTDIYYGAMSGEVLGECLAKVHSLAIHHKINLQRHIDLKREYNATRPFRHSKLF